MSLCLQFYKFYLFSLGRGSFICCNGSLQFGADDATGAWQRVCLESNVRLFEIQNLKRLINRVCELFGKAQMIVNPHASLVATTEYMQTIIVRLNFLIYRNKLNFYKW